MIVIMTPPSMCIAKLTLWHTASPVPLQALPIHDVGMVPA
jgi:hypothetical protein